MHPLQSGKINNKLEEFIVLPDGDIDTNVSAYIGSETSGSPSVDEDALEMVSGLLFERGQGVKVLYHLFKSCFPTQERTIKEATFNLQLSDKEKQDRAELTLPYTRSSQNAAVAGDTATSSINTNKSEFEQNDETPKNLIYVEAGDEDTDSDEDDDVDDDLDI